MVLKKAELAAMKAFADNVDMLIIYTIYVLKIKRFFWKCVKIR